MLYSVRRWPVANVSFLQKWHESYLMEKMSREWVLECVCVCVFELLRQASNCLRRLSVGGTTQEAQLKKTQQAEGKVFCKQQQAIKKPIFSNDGENDVIFNKKKSNNLRRSYNNGNAFSLSKYYQRQMVLCVTHTRSLGNV